MKHAKLIVDPSVLCVCSKHLRTSPECATVYSDLLLLLQSV